MSAAATSSQLQLRLRGDESLLAREALLDLALVRDTEGLDACDLRLPARGRAGGEIVEPPGELGDRLELSLGDRIVFVGEIVGRELELGEGDAAVTLHALDLRHRLGYGVRSQSFADVTAADIIARIARDHGLGTAGVRARDGEPRFPFALQHEQSDLEFVTGLARRSGRRLVMAQDTLHLVDVDLVAEPAHELRADRDLTGFYARERLGDQIGGARVRGWNVADKAAIDERAERATAMPNGRTGLERVRDRERHGTLELGRWPVRDATEARELARALVLDRSLAYVSAEAHCPAVSPVEPGQIVAVTGVGPRHSGRYYVASVRHATRSGQPLRSVLSLRRTST
jgi:phage protein D